MQIFQRRLSGELQHLAGWHPARTEVRKGITPERVVLVIDHWEVLLTEGELRRALEALGDASSA